MIKAIIFDMDGTICDTIPVITRAVNATLEAHGYPTRTQDEVRSFVGNGALKIIDRSLPENLGRDVSILGLLAEYNKHYYEMSLDTKCMYAGLADVLRELSKKYKIGVLSNKDAFILRPLCRQLFDGVCEFTAAGPENGLPTKPAKELTESLLERLVVTADEVVVVGDSDVDVKVANSIHAPHIGVTWGFRDEAFLRANGAETFAHVPGDLIGIIQGIDK